MKLASLKGPTRDGTLLLQWTGKGHRNPAFLIDETTGKVVLELPPADVTSFGPRTSTIVTSNGDTVEWLDFQGATLGSFKRSRKTPFDFARPVGPSAWCGVTHGSAYLEVYDFARLEELVSSNPPPKAATSRCTEVQRADQPSAARR